MTWTGSPRTTTAEWRATRQRILKRDHGVCHVCGKPGADEVDHIIPLAEGGTHADSNLAAIHDRPCHRAKSAQEGNRARHKHRAARPPVPHPGLTG